MGFGARVVLGVYQARVRALVAGFAAFLLLLLLPGAVQAQTALPARLQTYMDVQAIDFGFSGAVLVMRGERVLLRKAYGMADREWGVPNSVGTRFRIASVSKPFTAAAIMRLVEMGKLSLDDRLEQHLPGFQGGDRITIRMLLNHTSGLPRGHDAEVSLDMTMTHERALEMIRARPLAFEPGSKVGYSNTAFLLLSYIIERASGQSFAQFMQENIFRPAGLRDTGIFDPARLLPRRARSYRPWSRVPGGPVQNERWANFSMFQGHGNLYSTIDDLARFFRTFRGTTLLSRASTDAMLRFDPKDPAPGLGMTVVPYFNRRAFSHGGRYNGAWANAVHLPDEDLTVVVTSNNDVDCDTVAEALVGLVLGEDIEMPRRRVRAAVDPSILDGYAGKYGDGEISVSGGRLMVGKRELVPETPTRFFEANDPNVTYEFVRGGDGRATAVIYGRYGLRRTIPRGN